MNTKVDSKVRKKGLVVFGGIAVALATIAGVFYLIVSRLDQEESTENEDDSQSFVYPEELDLDFTDPDYPYEFDYFSSWNVESEKSEGVSAVYPDIINTGYTTEIHTDFGVTILIKVMISNKDVPLEHKPLFYAYNAEEFTVLNEIEGIKLIRPKTNLSYVIDNPEGDDQRIETSLSMDSDRNPLPFSSSPEIALYSNQVIEILGARNEQATWEVPIFGAGEHAGDLVYINYIFDDPIDLTNPPNDLEQKIAVCDQVVASLSIR